MTEMVTLLWRLIPVLVVLLLTSLPAVSSVIGTTSISHATGPVTDKGPADSWLIMVYMAGDNDLGVDGQYGIE